MLIGYVIIAFIFLSGPIINTDLTVALSTAVLPSDVEPSVSGNISYNLAIFNSGSPIIGKLTLLP